MKKSDIKPGYWARIKFDDVGARDVLVINKDGNDLKVYEPYTNDYQNVDISQVTSIGKQLTCEHSGL